MELTIHGVEHIQDRTQMTISEVLAVIAKDAVVPLGSADGYEFLLFYSKPDRYCKIAVTTENRTHLVSVWEEDFVLPAGVAKVTNRVRRYARGMMNNLLRERYREMDLIERPALQVVVVKLEVVVGGKTAYIHQLGSITKAEGSEGLKLIIDRFREGIEQIISLIEEHMDAAAGEPVSYRISLWRHSKHYRQHTISHDSLRESLHTAQLEQP